MYCGSSNSTHHDGTAGETGGRSLVVLVRRKEEQTGQADTLEVERDKDRSKGSDVEQSTRLKRVGLVGGPVQEVLVRGVQEDESDQGKKRHDRLDDRVDDGDANKQRDRRPSRRPHKLIHLVPLEESLSRGTAGKDSLNAQHDRRDRPRVGLGGSGKG